MRDFSPFRPLLFFVASNSRWNCWYYCFEYSVVCRRRWFVGRGRIGPVSGAVGFRWHAGDSGRHWQRAHGHYLGQSVQRHSVGAVLQAAVAFQRGWHSVSCEWANQLDSSFHWICCADRWRAAFERQVQGHYFASESSADAVVAVQEIRNKKNWGVLSKLSRMIVLFLGQFVSLVHCLWNPYTSFDLGLFYW